MLFFVKEFKAYQVKNGKYGFYAKINNLAYSQKRMIELGYIIQDLTKDQYDDLQRQERYQKKDEFQKEIDARDIMITNCLKCTPINIIESKGGNFMVRYIANTSDSELINQYRGIGKGTAYCKNNKVHAFHYGYTQPSKAIELVNDGYEAVKVEFSGTQICFS
jgi:hypothetical protein